MTGRIVWGNGVEPLLNLLAQVNVDLSVLINQPLTIAKTACLGRTDSTLPMACHAELVVDLTAIRREIFPPLRHRLLHESDQGSA